MKALRYLILAIIGIIVLVAAAIAIAIAVIDPNDYKPQIEKAVEDNTNLDLILDGDIGWSFIPLGLELNNVEAKLDDQSFVSLQQLIAQLDFWSLISMSPRVNTFVLDGLDANLSVDKQGNGNWTRIMKEDAAATGTPSDGSAPAEDSASTPAAAAEEGGAEPLNFNVENVQISNARVHYDDQATGQSVTLDNFAVNARDITLGVSAGPELPRGDQPAPLRRRCGHQCRAGRQRSAQRIRHRQPGRHLRHERRAVWRQVGAGNPWRIS